MTDAGEHHQPEGASTALNRSRVQFRRRQLPMGRTFGPDATSSFVCSNDVNVGIKG